MKASIPRKKFKSSQYQEAEDQKDLISALPDHLLVRILSMLPDSKYAVRTCVLSKRWRYLWTHVHVLLFRDYNYPPSEFFSCVHKTMAYHMGPKVKKFEIKWETEDASDLDSRIDLLIRFALLKGVEELVLNFAPDDHSGDSYDCYFLPHFVCSNHSIKELHTGLCDFVRSGKVDWVNLRILEIGFSNLDLNVLENILRGSPILEFLKLYGCLGIDRIDITSKSLKTLVLDNIWLSTHQMGYSNYYVSGPFLQKLEISSKGFHQWKLMNLPCLVSVMLDICIIETDEADFDGEVIVDYGYMSRHTVKEILEQVQHVEELKLGKWCIQVLSTTEFKGFSSPSLNCKTLVLQVGHYRNLWDLPGITNLLFASDKLEKLKIDFSSYSKYGSEFAIVPDLITCIFTKNYWRSHQKASNWPLNFQVVEICGFTESLYEREFIFDFIEFLLENAQVLETMIIYRDGKWSMENAVKMYKDLLNFRRSSPQSIVNIVCREE